MTFLLNEPWLFFTTICLALFLSSILGYRLALITKVNEDSHHHEHINFFREGLFVLLGLLLGFTVVIVLPRFEQRRDLVNEEARAIEKAMLRAELLPEPGRSRTQELLREYVLVRVDFAKETLMDRQAMDRESQRTKAIQRQLWQQVIAVAQENQTAVIVTYIQALNDLIDVEEKRQGVFEARLPKTVWLIVFLVAVFQTFATGYSMKRRFWMSLVTTPLVVAMVMALIADMDSPHAGLIRIDQTSMERLAHEVTDTKP